MEAWWESRATPHTGARLYNGRATISEFRPKFLVAALLNLFLRLYRTLVTMSSASYYISSIFLPVDQILDDLHLVGLLTTYPPPRALLCSQHGPHPSGAPDREPVVLLSLPSCELLCACALCFCVLVCDMSFIHVLRYYVHEHMLLYAIVYTMCTLRTMSRARARRLRIEITTRLVERSWAKDL